MNLIEAYNLATTKDKMIRRKSWGKSLDNYSYVGFDCSFYYCAGIPYLGTVKCDLILSQSDMLDDWEVIDSKEIFILYDQYVSERNKAIELDLKCRYNSNSEKYYMGFKVGGWFRYLNDYPNIKPII